MAVDTNFGELSADKLILRLEAGEALRPAEEGCLEAQFEMASGFRVTNSVLDEMQAVLDGGDMSETVAAYLTAFQGLGASIQIDRDGVQSFLRAFPGARKANQLSEGLRKSLIGRPIPVLSIPRGVLERLRVALEQASLVTEDKSESEKGL